MDQPKWKRRSDERPGEIIAAAYAVFAEKGFAAAKLDDIAARAGVSKGALYLYFDTKEDIFAAVVGSAVSPNLDAIAAMAAGYDGPLEPLLRRIGTQIGQLAAVSPVGRVAKLVIGESGNFPELARIWHDEVVMKGLAALSALLERGQLSGQVRPGDPRVQAVSLISPVLMAVIFRETFGPVGARTFDIPALVSQHLDTLLPGLLIPMETT